MTDEPSVERLVARRAPMLEMGDGGLAMEGVALAGVARAVGTPAWVIGAGTIRDRFGRLARALAGRGIGAEAIHYAVKANDHRAVLSLMSSLGAGADAVSWGEIGRALAAGVPASRIVFSGVGKTEDELARAVSARVGQINVESAEELRTLGRIARELGLVQDVALRVNPDVDAGTEDKISTGRARDKFGIPFGMAGRAYVEAAATPGVRAVGFAVHIGSQILTAEPFARSLARVGALVRTVREAGCAVEAVDAGGGLGIAYGDGPEGDPEAFAGAIVDGLGGLAVRVAVEPGRWLVGPAGVLLASVVRVKAGEPSFLVLDVAMNDLARPSLYGAWHGIVPVSPWTCGRHAVDVVGPVCESSDVLARGRVLPATMAGEVVAILDAGAYGAVMSSTYNSRPLAPVVMVDGGRMSLVRPRQAVDALWRDETVPEWAP